MYSRPMQVHEPDLVDINPSGTRKEELLLDRLRKTRTNIEFLMQVSKSSAGTPDD